MARLTMAVSLMLLFLSGCAGIAADYVLHYGSNRGGKPFPKTLTGCPAFARGHVVRVQNDPPVDLLVWIVEPGSVQVCVEDKNSPRGPAESINDPLAAASITAAGAPTIRLRRRPANAGACPHPLGDVIVLQGQGGCARTDVVMLPMVAALAEAGYRVIMPDLRSQGDSTGEELGFIVKDAQDIGDVLDWLEQENLLTDKVGILGHSYGAAVAGYVAMQDDRVATCILSGLPTTWRTIIEYQGSRNLLWRLMSDKTRQQTFQICSQRIGYDIDSLDSRRLIALTDKPVLLIHGRQDKCVPASCAAEVLQARPEGTQFVMYEDSGHGEYFVTRFEDVRSLCLSWFAEHLKPPLDAPCAQ
jgi:pimeloyl-ACP methyl ester carboxylesterase